MRNVSFSGCVVLMAALTQGVSSAQAAPLEPAASFEEYVVDGRESVEGVPLVEYTNLWWQWTVTMPKALSPVRDKTGQHCAVGQTGNVWFLAGGFGTSKIKRRCEIPAGKYLFFPVINMLYYTPEGEKDTCDEVKKDAALNNDELLSIAVELDGVHAANPGHSRLASVDCFDLMAKVPRDQNPPKLFPAATDGYWIMLKPLTKGTHILKFNAMYDREKGAYAKMAQDIEYELIIK